MFNLERTERVIIAVLAIALLSGIVFALYRQSRPVEVRIEKFDAPGMRREEAAAKAAAAAGSAAHPININRAGADEIATLKGVGKALAERIVAYRAEHGLFLSARDIKKVKGIGDALFEKIKDDIATE